MSPTDWNKEKVISEIQKQATEGNAPSTENHPNLYQAARRYFSSWTDACHAAGVKAASEA